MKYWAAIVVTSLLLLCGCKNSTTFSAAQVESPTIGQDAEFKVISGIPVWIYGKPNRPYVTIGVIVDKKYTRVESYEFYDAMERIARLAKKKQAEGVVIVSRTDPPPVLPEQPAESPEPYDKYDKDDNDTDFFGELIGELIGELCVAIVKCCFACFVSPGHDRIPFEVTAVPIKFTDTNAPAAIYPTR